ncbi:MAG: hypothetical protein FJ149_09330 [Euryarchaeota archaeon]|nr:hypothetical protein [Euryarchaeota archaeon]
MPWSDIKKRLVLERRQLAGTLLKELEENLSALAERKLLSERRYGLARDSDRLQFLGEELQNQLSRVYDRVRTINDALVKYQRCRSAGAGQEGYEKKTADFQQYIAWYSEGLHAALVNLRARLAEEEREPAEPETMARKQ